MNKREQGGVFQTFRRCKKEMDTREEIKCPKCGKQMEQGRGGAMPVSLEYHWAGCTPCGLYETARSPTELEGKLRPPEKQEIEL